MLVISDVAMAVVNLVGGSDESLLLLGGRHQGNFTERLIGVLVLETPGTEMTGTDIVVKVPHTHTHNNSRECFNYSPRTFPKLKGVFAGATRVAVHCCSPLCQLHYVIS